VGLWKALYIECKGFSASLDIFILWFSFIFMQGNIPAIEPELMKNDMYKGFKRSQIL
jgi:hypothetical protein